MLALPNLLLKVRVSFSYALQVLVFSLSLSHSPDVLNGFNATIFAYGQTSSGKTHTMEVHVTMQYMNGLNVVTMTFCCTCDQLAVHVTS